MRFAIARRDLFALVLMTVVVPGACAGRPSRGPFNPEAWPPTIDTTKQVHFVSIDNAFKAPSPNWQANLKVLTGGDHQTDAVTIGRHDGVRVSIMKFNTADDQYQLWANEHTVDILLQVFGDDALVTPDGKPRYVNFLTGTLPDPIAVDGGEISPSIKNGKWNWILFRIPNGLRHMDGGRLVGTINPHAKDDPGLMQVSRLSGQNGGTIRIDGLHDLKIRLVAFGQKGAFGEPDLVNRFRR